MRTEKRNEWYKKWLCDQKEKRDQKKMSENENDNNVGMNQNCVSAFWSFINPWSQIIFFALIKLLLY